MVTVQQQASGGLIDPCGSGTLERFRPWQHCKRLQIFLPFLLPLPLAFSSLAPQKPPSLCDLCFTAVHGRLNFTINSRHGARAYTQHGTLTALDYLQVKKERLILRQNLTQHLHNVCTKSSNVYTLSLANALRLKRSFFYTTTQDRGTGSCPIIYLFTLKSS